jgi:hypothetical protein
MRTPLHLLNASATVYVQTESISNTGARVLSDGSGVTVRCRVETDSSSEALAWSRTTGFVRAKGYFDLTNSGGTALAMTKETKVVIGSTTYHLIGPPREIPGGLGNVLIVADMEVRS